jgi:hypothetical protein
VIALKGKAIWHPSAFRYLWFHVDADFGITGNGLKKICIKHDIPRPQAGYFMMKADIHKMSADEIVSKYFKFIDTFW